LSRSGLRTPAGAPVRFSTSSVINRSAAKASIARTRSVSAFFSIRSRSTILSLVIVISGIRFKLRNSNPNRRPAVTAPGVRYAREGFAHALSGSVLHHAQGRHDGEALEAALGDDITPTLKRLLVRTYDGDLDTLTGLIEAVEAEGDVRAAALAVLSNLTATGRIARDKAEAYVLEAVSGAVRQAFGRGLTDPMVMGDNDVRQDRGRTLADPKLSGPSAFSDAANREQ